MILYILTLLTKKQAAIKSQQFLPPIGLEDLSSPPYSLSSLIAKLTAKVSVQLWLEINCITQRFQFMMGSHGNIKQ